MHFKFLCILLLMKTLKIDGRRRIPIPAIEQQHGEVLNLTTENLNLPHGFNPAPSPMNPLLYPFATEDPIKALAGTTSGWKPVINSRIRTESPSVMRDSRRDRKRVIGAVLEPIVYGARDIDEGPVQPRRSQIQSSSRSSTTASTTQRSIQRQQIGGFIEEVTRRDASKSSSEEEKFIYKRPLKHGRRKIPNFIERTKNNESVKSENIETINILKVNATHPELRDVIKQINESVETMPIVIKSPPKETSSSAENPYAPKLLNTNPQITKEWPIDFMSSSNEDTQQQQNHDKHQDNYINYVGDSSDPPRAIANLNFDELLESPESFNITKMGVPFENVNSNEEPTICVPLSVRERSASSPSELLDIERVYCFPLPPTDIKNEFENRIDNFDKDDNNDDNMRGTSYEELSISKGMYTKGTIFNVAILSIGILLI